MARYRFSRSRWASFSHSRYRPGGNSWPFSSSSSGVVLIGIPGLRNGGNSVVSAIALFLAASAVLSIYFLGVRHWQVEPRQALAMVSLPTQRFSRPIWFFFLPPPSTMRRGPRCCFRPPSRAWDPASLRSSCSPFLHGFGQCPRPDWPRRYRQAQRCWRYRSLGYFDRHRVGRHRDRHCRARCAPQLQIRKQRPVEVAVVGKD